MATGTDLDGMLYEDEDNLVLRLTHWLANSPELPLQGRAHWKERGDTSSRKVAEITVNGPNASATAICNQLEEEIKKQLGPNPAFGGLRIRFWSRSQSSNAGVDLHRTLTAGEGFEGQDKADLLRELNEARRERREFAGLLKEMFISSMTSNAQKDQVISTLGTMRAVPNAASDIGGVWNIVNIGLLVFGYPILKKVLGLPDTADGNAVVTALQKRVLALAMSQGEESREEEVKSPPPLPSPPRPVDMLLPPSPSSAPPPADKQEDLRNSLDSFIQDLIFDEKLQAQVLDRIRSIPGVSDRLKSLL